MLSVHDGRAAILLDGAVQSVAVPEGGPDPAGYWPALLPEARPERVLILGLGGGTVVQLLWRRFGAGRGMTVIGVEDDARVVALARELLGARLDGLTIMQAGADEALRRLRAAGERFDLVIIDLFRAGRVPEFVCSRRFLALVADALAPGGLATFNLDRGQGHAQSLRRLRRRFAAERIVTTGLNLVVHARARAKSTYARHQRIPR